MIEEKWSWFVCGISIGVLASGGFTQSSELGYIGIALMIISVILYIFALKKQKEGEGE